MAAFLIEGLQGANEAMARRGDDELSVRLLHFIVSLRASEYVYVMLSLYC